MLNFLPSRCRLPAAALVLGVSWSAPAPAQLPVDRTSTFSVDLTSSVGAASVQPSEPLDGSLRGATVQFTHPLGNWAGLQWHYVVEVTPLMSARLGASPERLAQIGPGLRPLYAVRRGVGFGIAPLGVQLARPLGHMTTSRTRAMLEMTGGGARYSQIMPYGDDGTHTNYTFEMRLLAEHRVRAHGAFAVGLGLHHISNGGFGKANPGINARMLVIRWTRHTPTS